MSRGRAVLRAADALALGAAIGAEAFVVPIPDLQRTGAAGRRALKVPALCARAGLGGGAGLLPLGRRAALSLFFVTAFSSEASAKKAKEKPCEKGKCVRATSPGVALDMIIVMKVAKGMREAGAKVPIARIITLCHAVPSYEQ